MRVKYLENGCNLKVTIKNRKKKCVFTIITKQIDVNQNKIKILTNIVF